VDSNLCLNAGIKGMDLVFFAWHCLLYMLGAGYIMQFRKKIGLIET